MRGKEYPEHIIAETVETSRFIVRYNPDIDTSLKIKFKGEKYKILSLVNDDEQNRTMTIIAETIKQNTRKGV